MRRMEEEAEEDERQTRRGTEDGEVEEKRRLEWTVEGGRR